MYFVGLAGRERASCGYTYAESFIKKAALPEPPLFALWFRVCQGLGLSAFGASPGPFSLTLRWFLTFNPPEWSLAICSAVALASFVATVPDSSTSLSDTCTLMLALARVGSFCNADWMLFRTSEVLAVETLL